MLTASPLPSARRTIRFAPLPDPRRSVLITDDGDELPIPAPVDDLTQIPVSLLLPPPSPAPIKSRELSASEPPPVSLDDRDCRDASSGSSLSSSSSTSASATSTPRTTTPSEYSPVSSVGSSPVTLNSALPLNQCPPLSSSTSSSSSGSTPTPPNGSATSSPPSSWPKPRSLSLLRPFKRSSNTVASSASSSHSLTPTPSIDPPSTSPHARRAISPEEILTLGTINLFRTSSRESRASTDSTSTATNSIWGFGRRTSPESNPSTLFSGSSPLARTESAQSYNSHSKAKRSIFSFSSESSASLSAVPSDSKTRSVHKSNSVPPVKPPVSSSRQANRHKGARMLNGRVYGSKRQSALAANPFANAREEDDFVEWGYGGMGSVKGAKSAGVAGWEKLHGNVTTTREKEGVGGVQDDEDDGSGMTWVRKRREERERKEKERLQQEVKERGGSEQANGHVADPSVSVSVSVQQPTEATLSPEAAGNASAVGAEEMTSESKLSTPTPTRSSTMDGIAAHAASLRVGEDLSEEQKSSSKATLSPPRPTLSPAPDSAATIVPSLFTVVTPTSAPSRVGDKEKDEEEEEGYVFGSIPQEEAAALELAQFEKEAEPEHVPVVVSIPVHHRHHSHSHGHRHHRTVSSLARSAASGDEEEPKEDEEIMIDYAADADEAVTENGAPAVHIHQEQKEAAVEDASAARRASVSSTTSSTSTSSVSEESESESDDGEEGDEEEEEEEEEEEDVFEDEKRKTALGAGVEKVSRHNRE